ncbi:MAG: hypothetical protein ACJ8DC_10255 [Gemmatimonadales bacterium]
MTFNAAVPFVIRRVHGVVSGREVTSTREDSYGLLRLEAGRMLVQWSTARETSRVGREIRVDRDLGPVREVPVPLAGLAGCKVRWRLLPWPPRWQLVLRAADLQAFGALAGETGLLLEHPAELVLELRRADREVARAFALELDLALAERAIEAAETPDRLTDAGLGQGAPRLSRSSDGGTELFRSG